MLRHNLKIAFRNLAINKTYSSINIIGLALGMAVSVLIMSFVMHELSYDKFHKNHEQIFRVLAKIDMNGENLQMTGFSPKFAPTLKSSGSHVQDFVRVLPSYDKVVMKNPKDNHVAYEEHFMFTDPSLFNVFSFKLKYGDPKRILDKPFTLIISERAAKKYFGKENPIGKVLLYDGIHAMQVAGIAENPPSNSSLQFDFVTSILTYPQLSEQNKKNFDNAGVFTTYLFLDSEKSVASVEKTIKKQNTNPDAFDAKAAYTLEPFAGIHLGNDFNASGNTGLILIFAGIAGLILFLALFNYMSLTTARATLRSKEVAVRKVVGSGRKGLMKQFYAESVLLCVIAFVLSFGFVQLFMQPFFNLLDLHIDTAFLVSPSFIAFLFALLVVTAILAGSYPALVLSAFNPLEVLKGRFSGNRGGAALRRLFMVFQFTVSIALIVCSLVVRHQLNFMQNKQLGLYKDQVLAIPISKSLEKNYFALRNEIRDQAGVRNVTTTNSELFKGFNIWFAKNLTTQKDVGIVSMMTDNQFVNTLGLKWKTAPVAGNYKNRSHVLLNETAIKELGIKGNPIGQKVIDNEIAGIVKDFNYDSPAQGIHGVGVFIVSDTTNILKFGGASAIIYARLDAKSNVKEKVEAIGDIFKKYELDKPFEYYFLNDAFNETFKTQIRMSKTFSVFTGVAIFIACMGLFGLVTFTAQTRTKEIGIRKVLGASVAGIVAMISKDFVKLILISIVIALPAAWYFMDKWLQDFSYRITIPVWIYLVASILAVAVALLTISFQSIKAALVNPVESLKSE
ncbi:ABC transporter permease [Dyadobacter luticola]|uniref:FtsX-like permease family protein n=1 Tax=Dyadobacter luticola TaxID=1979387 RepID=A0A5R9KY18_9BACT|nr:ABC transporter permease [Dyadobacter luticola]TLV01019.1 FtsX-like permease family protein [Dyadobacter luticola]